MDESEKLLVDVDNQSRSGANLCNLHFVNGTLLFCFLLVITVSLHINASNWQPFLLLRRSYGSTSDHHSSTPKHAAGKYAEVEGYAYLFPNVNRSFNLENLPTNNSIKLILLWLDGQETFQSSGSAVFEMCPENRCALTTNVAYLNESAAVLFLAAFIACGNQSAAAPKRAFPGQIYTYVMEESPINGLGCGYLLSSNFFNWTMTYRLDSDIRAHYMYQVPVETQKDRDFTKLKTKLVAWFVSDCHTQSKREDFVAELRKYIHVDVFGKYGDLSCTGNCDELLKGYKFYLAFENSICLDYVTEKMIRALEHETVPVVYGDGNYQIFPTNSYIHAFDFASPANLADYLLYLDGNNTAYNELMKWRYDPAQTRSHGSFSARHSGFCRLCQKLHQQPLGRRFKIYPDIRDWWESYAKHPPMHCTLDSCRTRETACRSPDFLLKK